MSARTPPLLGLLFQPHRASLLAADGRRSRGLMMQERTGVSLPLASLMSTATRTQRRAALALLEDGLRKDGWIRIISSDQLEQAATSMYCSATDLMSSASACAAHKREVLYEAAVAEQHLALTYLGIDEEPLYDVKAAVQRVRSLNVHELLTPAELDARLPETYSGDERQLAYAYHSVPRMAATAPTLAAAAELRRVLAASVCGPVLQAFALLLGLDEAALQKRCCGTHSDNSQCS